jgi:hypothetical protein
VWLRRFGPLRVTPLVGSVLACCVEVRRLETKSDIDRSTAAEAAADARGRMSAAGIVATVLEQHR